MGGEDIIPIPAFRCPWRRNNPKGVSPLTLIWDALLDDILGARGYEMTQGVQVVSKELGLIKVGLIVVVFVAYLYWQFLIGKGYLAVAPIVGVARMQLQHPVQGHCNPLKANCNASYRDFSALPYCSQHGVPQNISAEAQETCEYFDAFDLEFAESQMNKILIPTRRTLISQELRCDPKKGPCDQKYVVKGSETVYVADVESFTLLVDHAFMCEELGFDRGAWDMAGFYVPCMKGPEESSPCGRQAIEIEEQFEQHRNLKRDEETRLRGWWVEGKAPHVNPFYKIPNGDVIRIGPLLEILGVDLDALKQELDGGNSTMRREGVVLIMEIDYYNYKANTMPNKLPPIYEYNFMVAPAAEYQVRETLTPQRAKIVGLSSDVGDRVIDDRHGIFVHIKQRGTLGRVSVRQVTLMLVESSILLGIVHWIVHMMALNWWKGEAGDDFENELVKKLEFPKDEDGRTSMRRKPRNPTLRELPPLAAYSSLGERE